MKSFMGCAAIPTKKSHPQWDRVKGHRLSLWLNVNRDLANVNALVNRMIAYVPDSPRDHWQSPIETINRGKGDCEDFAILKRAYLLESNWCRDDELFLVIGYDNILRANHAILVWGGLILDHTTDKLLTEDALTSFTPKFAFSGVGSWVFAERKPTVA